jgi:hypothetical protein
MPQSVHVQSPNAVVEQAVCPAKPSSFASNQASTDASAQLGTPHRDSGVVAARVTTPEAAPKSPAWWFFRAAAIWKRSLGRSSPCPAVDNTTGSNHEASPIVPTSHCTSGTDICFRRFWRLSLTARRLLTKRRMTFRFALRRARQTTAPGARTAGFHDDGSSSEVGFRTVPRRQTWP